MAEPFKPCTFVKILRKEDSLSSHNLQASILYIRIEGSQARTRGQKKRSLKLSLYFSETEYFINFTTPVKQIVNSNFTICNIHFPSLVI